MKRLSHFVTTLIRHGELQLSKLLRRKSLERFNKFQSGPDQSPPDIVLIQNSISSKRATLLDFHSVDLSEQLTLLDSELFLKIRLSEILYMSIEKGEEYSPNLAVFTEHFNNISYW
jgi:Rap guanine nucleotide exchange factor 1